jgi:cytochrome c biogenesis protein CcmG, thiol:disulfide interchange protein DsbE
MAIAPRVRTSRTVPWAWLAGGVAAVIVAALVFGLGRDPRAIPSPLVGQPAPAFMLTQFDGTPLESRALHGRVVVLNFWASWCYPACYDEAPVLQQVWERYRRRGVMVVGINIQDQDRPAREFIARFAQTFPNGPDRTGRISIDYGVYGVPETFIIEPGGRVVYKQAGAVTESALTERIERLLGESSAP